MSVGRCPTFAWSFCAAAKPPAGASAPAAAALAAAPPAAVVIAGGGTGGHLFPGIAIAEEIRARLPEARVLFISSGNPFERRALDRAGFPLEAIAVEGLKGRGVWRQSRALARLPGAVLHAGRLLKAFRPVLVVGLGSYAAAPVVAAAWLRRLPIVLCEQNARPGLANRLLSRLAERIYTGFERTESLDPRKVLWTGNPLRREIVQAASDRAAWPPPASCPERFTVFVIGGSQGAHAVNRAVLDALPRLSGAERLFFVHQTGPADEAWVREAYREAKIAGRVQAFFDDMAAHYRQADLIVCRAGASTVAEVTALGKAALFIPFPHAADDHQRLNARRLAEQGAAEWIDEGELDGRRLAERILRHAGDPRALRAMAERAWALGRPDAARRIVDDLSRIAARRRPPEAAAGPASDEFHGGGRRDVP